LIGFLIDDAGLDDDWQKEREEELHTLRITYTVLMYYRLCDVKIYLKQQYIYLEYETAESRDLYSVEPLFATDNPKRISVFHSQPKYQHHSWNNTPTALPSILEL